jgi:hypothetical protein
MIEAIEDKQPPASLAQSTRPYGFEFVRECWEKRLKLLTGTQTLGLPKIEHGELFPAVVAAVEDLRRRGRQTVRFYVDGLQIDTREVEYQAILPRYDDESFIGYNRRMVERSGFKDYALIIADWHQFDRSLWERILDSLQVLTDMVGISRSRMDTQVFLGTYKITPFGVHVDPTSAFHFPVIGRKIMRFWEGSFAAKTPALQRTHNYERFLADSVLINASPGEVIYWPSDHWHVGESDGEFSVTWGLGYWVADNIRSLAIEEAMKVLEETKPKPRIIPPQRLAYAAEIVSPINDVIRDLMRAVSTDRFRQLMIQSWLEHCSAYGFLRVPPLLDELKIDARVPIQKKPMFRILDSPVEKGLICVASAGRSCVVPMSPAIRILIDRLNEGSQVTPIELFGCEGTPNEVVKLIDFFLRSGALTAV